MNILLRLIAVGLICLALTACQRLEAPRLEGALVVALVAEPSFRHADGTQALGFTEDFFRLFGENLGLPVRFHYAADAVELAELVLQNRVHVAAYLDPSIAIEQVSYSRPIDKRSLWVVQHSDLEGPQSLAELDGREIYAPVNSTAAHALVSVSATVKTKIVEVREHSEMELLRWLNEDRISLVAVDELNLGLAANLYPELQAVLRLPGTRKFSWAFAPPFAGELLVTADQFIEESEKNGVLPRLRDRHFGYVRRIDPDGLQAFIEDSKMVLPRYRRSFQLAQEITGFDWRLLAALAYQESKWNPEATSITNVRGMMMLTEDTADALGVANRLDANESIRGGARYLGQLMDQLPSNVADPDRLWLALAAYNLGMGHVNAGRTIARKLNKNPDSWFDMKSVLPLMSQPAYYERLKSGRARGGEAVILVENVRSYYSLLAHLEPAHVPLLSIGGTKPGVLVRLPQMAQPVLSSSSAPPK
ncbi:MAG: membrane-bound lytic murein transglycosylase MltF [Rhodocyclaceae bacterium]|nr:membrane-bound lytic murein transglycosylase MltF [Rhodocyclaceae bacterium]